MSSWTARAAHAAILAAGLAAASCSAQPPVGEAKGEGNTPAAAEQTQAAPANAATSAPAASGWSVSRDAKGCTLAAPSQYANIPVGAEEEAALMPFSTGTMSWSGACPGGKVEGVGVARMLAGGKPVGFWYGRADAGRLGTGVIVDGHGNFDAVQASGDTLRAIGFDDAALPQRTQARDLARQALTAYVAGLESSGNAASATHYRQHIEVIDTMDEGE